MKKYSDTNRESNTLNEQFIAYSKNSHFLDKIEELGFDNKFIKELSFDDILRSKPLLIKFIKNGISPRLFKAIVDNSPFYMYEWIEFLDLPLRTIQRYLKENKLFKPVHTEKIIEFSILIKQGIDTFGSVDKFKSWLCTPSYIFSGQRPCNLISTSIGIQMVSEELINIDYGLFS